MPVRLTKLKNYEVHSVTSAGKDTINANIATWVMQSALKATHLTVAMAAEDFTYELISQTGRCNVHLLGMDQMNYINRLGRKSGRDGFKLKRIPYELDDFGLPVLAETIGYFQCKVEGWLESGDHWLASCRIEKMVSLNRDQIPLRVDDLRAKGLIRG